MEVHFNSDARETLDRRYDDMDSGRVFARLRAKSAARRAGRQ